MIRARFGFDADDCAGRIPVFRAEIIRLDSELLDGIGVWEQTAKVLIGVDVLAAVEEKVHARLTAAID